MHGSLGERTHDCFFRCRLISARPRREVVRERLERTEEDDADADPGTEEHRRPAHRRVFDLLAVDAKRDAPVLRHREVEQEEQDSGGERGEDPPEVVHDPGQSRRRDVEDLLRLGHTPDDEGDDEATHDKEDGFIHAVAHLLRVDGHARHQRRVDIVRINDVFENPLGGARAAAVRHGGLHRGRWFQPVGISLRAGVRAAFKVRRAVIGLVAGGIRDPRDAVRIFLTDVSIHCVKAFP